MATVRSLPRAGKPFSIAGGSPQPGDKNRAPTGVGPAISHNTSSPQRDLDVNIQLAVSIRLDPDILRIAPLRFEPWLRELTCSPEMSSI